MTRILIIMTVIVMRIEVVAERKKNEHEHFYNDTLVATKIITTSNSHQNTNSYTIHSDNDPNLVALAVVTSFIGIQIGH